MKPQNCESSWCMSNEYLTNSGREGSRLANNPVSARSNLSAQKQWNFKHTCFFCLGCFAPLFYFLQSKKSKAKKKAEGQSPYPGKKIGLTLCGKPTLSAPHRFFLLFLQSKKWVPQRLGKGYAQTPAERSALRCGAKGAVQKVRCKRRGLFTFSFSEREGFEPSVRIELVQRISNQPLSTTQPSLLCIEPSFNSIMCHWA
jgi:hypothetical protein